MKATENENQIKVFENLSFAFERHRLSLSKRKCIDLLSALNSNAKNVEQFFTQYEKISAIEKFLTGRK